MCFSHIYAQSDGSASPYAAGPRTGTWYGAPVDGSRSDTNAALMYVTFQDSYSVEYWIDYYSRTSESFRKAADGGVIEVAWNFSPENTSGPGRSWAPTAISPRACGPWAA